MALSVDSDHREPLAGMTNGSLHWTILVNCETFSRVTGGNAHSTTDQAKLNDVNSKKASLIGLQIHET